MLDWLNFQSVPDWYWIVAALPLFFIGVAIVVIAALAMVAGIIYLVLAVIGEWVKETKAAWQAFVTSPARERRNRVLRVLIPFGLLGLERSHTNWNRDGGFRHEHQV